MKKLGLSALSAIVLSMVFAISTAAPSSAWVIGSGYNATCQYGSVSANWVGRDDRSCPGILNVYYQGSFAYRLNAGYMDTAYRRKCEARIVGEVVTVFITGLSTSWKTVSTGLTRAGWNARYGSCVIGQ